MHVIVIECKVSPGRSIVVCILIWAQGNRLDIYFSAAANFAFKLSGISGGGGRGICKATLTPS